MAGENLTTIGGQGKPESARVILDEKREEKVVMGLKHLMALGDALLCIASAHDRVIIAQDTIPSLASLITDTSEQVWDALVNVVI
jgi:hypothetical protein